MAYERYGRDDAQNNSYGWDRENYGASSAREYRSAGDLGGYGRDDQQRGYGRDDQRNYGQRNFGQRDYGQRDYGARDQGRQEYGYGQRDGGSSDYGRDYGQQRYGQNERDRGNYVSWNDRDRQGFGSDDGRGGSDRGSYGYQGRDTYRQSRGTFDRQPQSYDRNADRGFFERAGDEVRSWFGDEDAERRRERDARDNDRSYASGYGRDRDNRDDHYTSWRNQQIDAFDRDYDEYRQENRTKFNNEFSTFRTERQGQRDLLNKVDEHMEVVGSDGAHVGTVDKVRDDRVVLTKNDADAGGRHHSIPSRWLQSAADGKLTLSKTAEEAKQHWRDEERQSNSSGTLFGGNGRQQTNQSNDGSDTARTTLNRSFSGTY